jgi:hypothetical protein
MSTICVIGNSPNVLEEELGEKIDSCDVIIRIQKFKTRGFEKYVGSKTTVVAFAWRDVKQIMSCIDYAALDIDSTIFWSTYPLIHGHVHERHETVAHILGHTNILQPSSELYMKVLNEHYSDFWNKRPSSGIMTIELALQEYSNHQIFICGFDSTLEKAHYYDLSQVDKFAPGMTVSGHNWEAEWKYIGDLMGSGKISHIRNKL